MAAAAIHASALSASAPSVPPASSASASVDNLSQMSHIPQTPDPGSPLPFPDHTIAAMEQLTSRFESMLKTTLSAITDKLTADINDLKSRTVEVENRVDLLETDMASANHKFHTIHEDNLQIMLKLEDLENRSRRSNLRIRGIPEHVVDIPAIVLALFQELDPSITVERLETERAHRALTRRRPDGPPRDIVIKLFYYKSKETLLQAAREKSKHGPLIFQGHQYQPKADIAPSTIARRREFKPFLEVLNTHKIPYKWGFPFRLLFSYHNIHVSTTTLADLASSFRRLNIPLPHSSQRPSAARVRDSPEKKKARLTPSPSPRTRRYQADHDAMD